MNKGWYWFQMPIVRESCQKATQIAEKQDDIQKSGQRYKRKEDIAAKLKTDEPAGLIQDL